LELRQDSNLLDDDNTLNAFLNNRFYANTLLEPQIDVDPKLIKELTLLFSEFFDEACPAKEAKDVALAFKEKLKETHVWLNQVLTSKETYPFLSVLSPVADFVDKLVKKEYTHYLTNIKDFEDTLLDFKEQIIDPIKRFWNGEQKKIYDSIRMFLSGDQSNLQYVEGDELDILTNVIEHPKPYTGDIIKDAKAAKDALTTKVLKRIEDERELTKVAIEGAISRIQSHEDFKSLYEANQQALLKPFHDELKKLKEQRFIAYLRDIRTNVMGQLLQKQLDEMVRLAKPKEKAVNDPPVPIIHYRQLNTVKVNFSKSELQTKEDVEKYVEALKSALTNLIAENKRISL